MVAYVGGTAVYVGWADRRRNLYELIFATVRDALDDAGLAITDFDSLVCACQDLTDGRSLSSMITAPAAGAYMKDEVRVSDDGAVALALAAARVESGLSERSLVVAWGRGSEGDVNAITRAAYDPFFQQPLGMTDLMVSRLRAARWLGDHGVSEADRDRARTERSARVTSADRAAAETGPAPSGDTWPLHPDELPRFADVVAALTLSGDPAGVAVAGIGQASAPYRPEDRSLTRAQALAQAGSLAMAEAGVTADEVDVVEVDGLTIFDEAIAVESLGLVPPGQGLSALTERPDWNAGGGSAGGYCPPAMGLVRCVDTIRRLRDRGASIGMASGAGSVSGQTQTAVVFRG